MTEENFLLNKFKDEYVNYAETVNCLVPSFKHFKNPGRHFSINTVLVREQDTMMSTALLFMGAETIMEYAQLGYLHIDTVWLIAFAATIVIYAILKYMKKHHLICAV